MGTNENDKTILSENTAGWQARFSRDADAIKVSRTSRARIRIKT
jgi:hypothetical protein